MNRSRLGLSVLMTFMMLTGCSNASAPSESSSQSEPEVKKVTNEEFLNSVKEGVQKRWKFADSAGDSVEPKTYITAVSDVLDEVKNYKDQEFENEDLKKAADQLIQDLSDSLSAAQMMENDPANGTLKYIAANTAYEDDIVNLYENYNLRFDDDYTKDFQDYMDSVKSDNQDGVREILELGYSLSISEETDENGFKQYKLNGQNNTDKTFNQFMYNLEMSKSDGTVVGTANSDSINSLEPGQKFSVPVYYDESIGDLTSFRLIPEFQSLAAYPFAED